MAVELERNRDDAFRCDDMTPADLDQVLDVERRSFPVPWSRGAFVQEVTANRFACYRVVRAGDVVVGYAGVWVIMDEAHVTNVAVHPDWRGRGLGRRLMLDLIARALNRGATRMTLEVRASNQVAQNLYAALGFRACGRRRGYYSDTNEDAVIMWLDPLVRPRLGPPGG